MRRPFRHSSFAIRSRDATHEARFVMARSIRAALHRAAEAADLSFAEWMRGAIQGFIAGDYEGITEADFPQFTWSGKQPSFHLFLPLALFRELKLVSFERGYSLSKCARHACLSRMVYEQRHGAPAKEDAA